MTPKEGSWSQEPKEREEGMGTRVPGPSKWTCVWLQETFWRVSVSFMWSFSLVITLQTFSAGVISAWKSRWPGDSWDANYWAGTPWPRVYQSSCGVFVAKLEQCSWLGDRIPGSQAWLLPSQCDLEWVIYPSWTSVSLIMKWSGCWFLPLPSNMLICCPRILSKFLVLLSDQEILKTS